MPNGDTSMTYPYPYKTQDGDDQIVGINSFNIGATTTLPPGSAATVINSGTTEDLVLYFGIPEGKAATVAVGATTTLPYSDSATVTNSGTSAAAILNFGIPQGEPGSTSYNAGSLEGFTWETPSAIGTTLPNTGIFTSLTTSVVNGDSPTPTLTFGTGGGAGASGSIVGSSTSGLLVITTGAAPAASSNVVTITFVGTAYTNPPAVILEPASGTTASMAIASFLHPITTTTSFTLISNTTALVAVTTFSFYYIVMG